MDRAVAGAGAAGAGGASGAEYGHYISSVQYHRKRQHTRMGTSKLFLMPGTENPADIMTKPIIRLIPASLQLRLLRSSADPRHVIVLPSRRVVQYARHDASR